MSENLLRDIYMKIRYIDYVSINSFAKSTSGYEATGVQFGVLRNIPLEGTITMSELSDKVKCVASNTTTIVRRMEKQALIVTYKNPLDKRQTMVSLTQKGIDVRNTMEDAYQSFLSETYGFLNFSERELLNNLLNKIEDNLNKK